MEVILYTTHCPRCTVLEKKLNEANVSYEENTNIDEMVSLGLTTAPALKVGDEIMNFSQAVAWVNKQENN